MSESVFRRYEPYIRQFVDAADTLPITFNPTTVSASTFGSWFRNAVKGVLHHRYKTDINLDTLEAVWTYSKVYIQANGTVVIGPGTAGATPLASDASASPITFAYNLDSPTLEQFNALIQLYASGLSSVPSRIVNPPESYAVPPTVAFEQQTDGSFILL